MTLGGTASEHRHAPSAGPLGAQFLLWEFATAVAGRVLGIDPFDQPNVQESKDNTERRARQGRRRPAARRARPLRRRRRSRCTPTPRLLAGATDLDGVHRRAARRDPRPRLPRRDGLPRPDRTTPRRLRSGTRCARRTERPVTFGWGPRFLHSTGQFHKGGPPVGVFLQITGVPRVRPRDPGPAVHASGELQLAQALGDRQALRAQRDRPLLRLHLTDRPAGLAQLLHAAGGDRSVDGASPATPGNPLRDPRDRRLPRVPGPCALVVFGVTGDLARKKLIPAIYDLANRGLLPPGFVLLGFARRDWDVGDFESLAREAAQEARPHRVPRGRLATDRRARCMFLPGAFDDDEAFDTLATTLDRARGQPRHPGQRRVLPVDPADARSRSCSSRCSAPAWPTTRRPAAGAGSSSRSRSATTSSRARELNALVDEVFTPEDVFRIDHYLGKETVQNMLALRFANTMFEPIWNAHYVDSVQITMAEDVGIGGRAAFYDSAGAARDVLQNHLLQLLALTAMEEPVSFDAEAIRTEKIKVLSAISLPDDLERYAIRGQYDQGWLAGERVPAYLDEKDIPTDSQTETYAAVRLGIETRRWAGVPFYLRTGKRLPRRVTEIAVDVQARAAPAVRRTPTPSSSARTSSSSGCSPTRASRCGSARRCRARRWRSATSRWTSCTARRSPSPRPRPTSG